MANTGGAQRDPEVRLMTVERERDICTLRLRGKTYAEIAAELAMSENGVQKAFDRAMRRIPESVARIARQASLERLNQMRAELWARLTLGEKPDLRGLNETIGNLIKIEAREARLLGLDAPQKLDVDSTINVDQDQKVARLEEVVRRMTDDERAEFLMLLRRARQRLLDNSGE